MYVPRHFAEQRPEALHALMREHPLATLVLAGAELDAHHLPLLLDTSATEAGGAAFLRGHVARANAAWRHAPAGEVLAVFHGPQTYVTPAWYPSKAQHGKVVPTWNYIAVHAYGELRWIDDAAWLRGLLNQLTDHHEGPRAQPWQMSDAPEDYVQQMMSAVVGLELRITRLVGKWKVSQNRPADDIAGVLGALETRAAPGDAALAAALAQRRKRQPDF